MTKSGFIGSILIIAFVFLGINVYSICSSLDQNSTLSWAKRFIWMWFGFGIIVGCYIIMLILIIWWYHSLCKYRFITYKNDPTDEDTINFNISQGISINHFRNPMYILGITSNVNNNDYRKIPIVEAPIDQKSMIPHATYVYLLKTFYEIKKDIYKDDIKFSEDILYPPDINNTLLYCSRGGLFWALISWGLLVSFCILMTLKLDDHTELAWRYIFIPLYCFIGLPILIWVIAICHSSAKINRYKWYIIGWIFDMTHAKKHGYKRYEASVLTYICLSIISAVFLSEYLDDTTPDTDYLYGVFLPQVCFFGIIFCWLLFWIIIPKIIDPSSRDKYPFHIVVFLLTTTGLSTTFFVLLWVRVQWATYAWSFILIPFIALCIVISLSILYALINYMAIDRMIDDYILSSIPFEHMTDDINKSNPSGSEPLLPDITTPNKETL